MTFAPAIRLNIFEIRGKVRQTNKFTFPRNERIDFLATEPHRRTFLYKYKYFTVSMLRLINLRLENIVELNPPT